MLFVALGGIPHRGIDDNMKTAVDKEQKGKRRIVNAQFARNRYSVPCEFVGQRVSDLG